MVAVAVSVLVLYMADRPPPVLDVVGNLLFLPTLDGYVCPVLDSNTALWSLSFEAFFYLVFALTIGRHQRVLLRIWGAASVMAAASQFVGQAEGALGQLQLVTAYSSIWLLGYYSVDLAGRMRVGVTSALAWSGLLPMAARIPFNGEEYLAARHLLAAATVLPLFALLIRRNQGERQPVPPYLWAAWAVAYAALAGLLFATSKSLFVSKVVYVTMPCVTAAAGWVFARTGFRDGAAITLALFLGRLSYALYLFHLPVFYSSRIFGLTGPVAAAVLVPAAVLVACVAEFYIQPRLSPWLFPVRHRASGRKDPIRSQPGVTRGPVHMIGELPGRHPGDSPAAATMGPNSPGG
jgi:peptidoglycan/LPS O-acetylase OafA/YrhL